MSSEPTKTTSEEADARQLDLARGEGEAYQRSFRHMIEDVAHTGDQTQAGDYVVGFAQEEAEGMYKPSDDGLEWTEPTAENAHLEVAVSDVADGRFVPGLDVTATLLSESGEQIGPVDLPFIWHPGLYHYGANLTVPGDGSYDLEIEIAPAPFHRHDEDNGDRYAEATAVTFEGVEIRTGQA